MLLFIPKSRHGAISLVICADRVRGGESVLWKGRISSHTAEGHSLCVALGLLASPHSSFIGPFRVAHLLELAVVLRPSKACLKGNEMTMIARCLELIK